MKKSNRAIAATLIACMLGSQTLAYAQNEASVDTAAEVAEFGPENFVKGTPNTFYAWSWANNAVTELDNLYNMYHDTYGEPDMYGTYSILNSNSPIEQAKALKAQMEKLPEGRRAFCYHEFPYGYLRMTENRPAGFWYDGMQGVADHLDRLLSAYKRMGGPKIDVIVSDQEQFSTPWAVDGFGSRQGLNSRQVWDRFVNDPRYITEIRPELEKLGFEFCYEEGENELKYAIENLYLHDSVPGDKVEEIRPGGKADNYLKLHAVMSSMDSAAVYESVYKVAQKHYPDILYANYDNYISPEEKDTPFYSPQGYIYSWSRRVKAGNMGSDECYGWPYVAGSKWDNFIPGYPFTKYHETVYNTTRYDLRCFQRSSMYTQNNCNVPWIGNAGYRWWPLSPGKTAYWDEWVFHSLMSSSLPFFFLYLGGNTVEDDYHLSATLHELDEVLGFEERVPLFEEAVGVDQEYMLSGMSAGGRNVWRITPDLCHSDFTLEDFLYDEENMIFKIANQYVDFPEGSFIYEAENENRSMFGYWVISPEGTRPEEYRDETQPVMEEPDILIASDDSHLTVLNQKNETSRELAKNKNK